MKLNSLLLPAIAIAGIATANAQETTTPVGYETITLQKSAFNYIGIRLHSAIEASGTGMSATNATTVQDASADFTGDFTADDFYILELLDGSGIIQEFLGNQATGTSITIPDDLASQGSFAYQIRKAATLASMFGTDNSAGLNPGFNSSAGADVVYVPDGSNGFDKYYYSSRFSSWMDADTNQTVDSTNVPLIYSDGLIIYASASAPDSITVSGEVKQRNTKAVLIAGFNYISTVAPTGGTLANMINSNELTPGFNSSTGADVIYVPDGSGGFNKYYYSSRFSGWANADNSQLLSPSDGSGVSLAGSGLIISVSVAKNITLKVPASYSEESP